MQVVIDTNCLLASIPPQSAHYWLYRAFRDEQFDWLISNEVLTEYEEKLTDYYSGRTATIVLNILSVASNVKYVEPYFKWQLVEHDADDNKFVDLAIAGDANFLVTNDKHFSPLKKLEFPKLNIISLQEFQKVLNI